MMYEIVIAVKPEITEDQLKSIKSIVPDIVAEAKGTVHVTDDWGVMRFAQQIGRGFKRGRYVYFMYQVGGQENKEITRKLGIDEGVIRHLIVNLGTEKNAEAIVKKYQNPNHQAQDALRDEELEKDRRMSSKRRSCWFSANKIEPDWKNPRTYNWLVNEFGKILPARTSGLRPHFQRMSNDAIKRGRIMGLISNLSNHIAIRS